MKKGLLLLCCVFLSLNLMAQVGCVSSNVMYPNKANNGNGNDKYDDTNPITKGIGCNWVPTSNPTTLCEVSNKPNGYLASTVQNCDIDTNVFFLMFSAIGFALFSFYRRNMVVN